MGDPDAGLVELARDELLAAGDIEGAAEAETRLAEQFWLAGDRDAAFAHLRRAGELVEPLPPSFVKAHAISTASRFRMLAGDFDEAIRLGCEALAMAEELGLDDVRAATLTNLGSSRASRGDEAGLDDLAEAARVAEGVNAFEFCRAKGNLAAQLWVRGELRRSVDLENETGEDAARFGQLGFIRWCRGVVVNPLYTLGDWDEATGVAEGFISEIESGLPHYLASQAYSTRALIEFARGRHRFGAHRRRARRRPRRARGRPAGHPAGKRAPRADRLRARRPREGGIAHSRFPRSAHGGKRDRP